MADRVCDFQFDDLVGQQSQCPVGKSGGRLAQPQRDDFRFLFPVEDFGPRRRFTFFPVQHGVKPFGDEPSSDIFDGSCPSKFSITP